MGFVSNWINWLTDWSNAVDIDKWIGITLMQLPRATDDNTLHTDKTQVQLERHSVERIYLRQRSSDGSVNKTILKPRLALAARRQYVYVGFSRRKISA